MRGRIHDSLDNSYNPIAELTVVYTSTPTYSGAAETDFIYQQGPTGRANVIGITWCNDNVDSAVYRCDQTYMRFVKDATYERRGLVCHETGHAVGLLHGANSWPTTSNTSSKLGCMRTPFDPSVYVLGPNNVTQIKDTY